jgi:hypothetical protein
MIKIFCNKCDKKIDYPEDKSMRINFRFAGMFYSYAREIHLCPSCYDEFTETMDSFQFGIDMY